jgi:hypothetical protein
MNSMIIGIILLAFFNFDHVEILKVNCDKRKKMVQVRNLFLEFEVPPIFYVALFFSFSYLPITRPHRIWWKRLQTIYTMGLDKLFGTPI